MASKKTKTVVVLEDYVRAAKVSTDVSTFCRAMLFYGFYGEVPEFTEERDKVLWDNVQRGIDIGKMRAKNGSKGGKKTAEKKSHQSSKQSSKQR